MQPFILNHMSKSIAVVNSRNTQLCELFFHDPGPKCTQSQYQSNMCKDQLQFCGGKSMCRKISDSLTHPPKQDA